MYLTWYGQSAFRLQDKVNGEGLSLALDPFDPVFIGLKWTPLEADIVAISHDHKDHNYLKGIKGEPFVINSAGEYEYKGVYIEGVHSWHDDQEGVERGANIIYRIEMDGLVVTHLGDLGATLDTKQLERLEGTDILLVPVGGRYTIDARRAVEVVNSIEPRLVIPMHYNLPGLKVGLDSLDKFIKELGLKPRSEDKLKISKKDLPTEDTELVVLTV